jgi:lysophospholipase L1-like esterase
MPTEVLLGEQHMKIKLLAIFSLLALTSCKEVAQKILVTGDSWAFFICYNNSIDKALNKVGILDAGANGNCAVTTQNGAHASEWFGSSFYKTTKLALKDKSVKVVYLSLGGNDFLDVWNKNMSTTEERAAFDKIANDVESVIEDYAAQRSDVKILLSGYDYPRFYDNHPIKQYQKVYEDMGKPTPYELNSAIVRYSNRVSQLADQKNIFYIQHYGLMHYYVGNVEDSLPAFKTLSPEQISPLNNINQVGGDLNSTTDPSAMLKFVESGVGFYDAFHLNRAGYDKIGEHAVTQYLKDWLKK